MKKLIFLLAWLPLCQSAFAQQTAPAAGPELTVNWGLVYYGSGHTMREQMKDNGFGNKGVSNSGFIPEKDFP